MWPPKYNLRSDDQSNTTAQSVQMSELETRFSETSSTSPGREPAAAPTTGDLQLPVYSRRRSSDTVTSTWSESSTLPNSQQPSLSDVSNPATARKRKNARHNTIEKRYREQMNKISSTSKTLFLVLEHQISRSLILRARCAAAVVSSSGRNEANPKHLWMYWHISTSSKQITPGWNLDYQT